MRFTFDEFPFFIIAGTIGVFVLFLLTQFLLYYIFPLFCKPVEKDEEGNYALTDTNKNGLSSLKETEDKFLVKRAEGVERVGLLLIFKLGILKIKRRYYIEYATDEVSIPKPKKGTLLRIFVTETDGIRRNIKKSLGLSAPIYLILMFVQIAFLLTISIVYTALHNTYNLLDFDEAVVILYFLPIVISIVLPIVSYFISRAGLTMKAFRKEVK